ncbi:uncharacterized protein LTR77_006369 [Saxophila tyrrhenica]|uniref:Beta-lactamase-related domain-containing protein n=1 Tax=Saxophila tyrrhenica TaxID=1690608 RepID=A0AAV9PBY3_9PEZI|nr:hypothetical protein LTR77_006369 [Saxophila tyrrhenica]
MNILQQLEKSIVSPNQLNTAGVPSASVAILEDGKISAHVITNGQENTETVYQACSISKAITALAVAKLVDEGRISYDTPVVDHLPQSSIDCIVDSKTSHLMQHVTVSMLLSHTAGLSQHGFPGYLSEPPSAEDVLVGQPPSNTPKMHFITFPGAQFKYSGGGYTVLQLFLEALLEKSFPEIMDKIVLKPLGMTRSWYGDIAAGETNYASARWTAEVSFPGDAKYHRFIEHAAAGLWCTPSDLLRAVSAVQDSIYTDTGFVSQETAKKMLTSVYESSMLGGMGLGWPVGDQAFAHAGDNWPGYTAYVFASHGGINHPGGSVQPRNGVAVMVNSVLGHDVAIKKIVSAIYYLKGWERFKMLPSGYGKDDYAPYAAPEGTPVDEAWKDWVGDWGSDWHLVGKDGPAWQYRQMQPMKLKPAAAPVEVFEDGRKELFLVIDGLKVGVRLTWEDGRRVVQLLQNEPETLKRPE